MQPLQLSSFGFVTLWLSCLSVGGALADDAQTIQAATDEGAIAVAGRIDSLIARQWKLREVTPAPPADDSEFLRRVYLDIAGKTP